MTVSVSLKRLLAAVAILSILAACSDDKTKDEEPADLTDVDAQLKVERLWSYGFGGDSDRLRLALRATVANDVAYAAGYNGEVTALAAATGRKVWSIKTKLPLSAGPAVGNGIVVVGASDGTVIALNSVDGVERWRTRLSSEVLAMPVVTNGIVLIRTVDGRLVALDETDAKQKWVIEQQVPRLSLRGTAPPVVAGDVVYAGFDNGRVVAVELATGDTQWDTAVSSPRGRNELERLIDIDAPVRAVGEDILVMGFQGRVAMLARDSGQIWWAQDFSSYRGFTVQEDSVYASNAEGVVVAMRRVDGSVMWEQPALHLRVLTAPAIDGRALVVGDYEGYLHWLDPVSGQIIARKSTDGERITNAPLAVDGRVFVQTDGGKLIAFKTEPKPAKKS
jgi:outer membrane protein assembly factor BamB